MLRVLCLLVLYVVLGTGRADAARMVHYDLAGLLLQADAVVVAERIGDVRAATSGGEPMARYRVMRSLVGPLKAGADVIVWDAIYDTRGQNLDPRAVLFLEPSNPGWRIVSSGLRVIANGKVWRFEQQSNPGPFSMVPQGKDPQDQWGLGGAQLDLAGLERAIVAAGKRIVALGVARTIADPVKRRAAVLALFTSGASATGAYSDRLATEARQLLAGVGDLEGALLVDLRDRGGAWRGGSPIAKVDELVAFAKDGSRSTEVRVHALVMAGAGFELHEDFTSLRAIVALLADPSPAIRAAAVEAAANPANVSMSDRVGQRKLDAMMVEVRAAIAKRYAIEQDQRVLAAIAEEYRDTFKKPLPARTGGPKVAAVPSVADQDINIDVYCLKPIRITNSSLTLVSPSGPVTSGTFNISVHCDNSTSLHGAPGNPIPAGSYQLGVELVPSTGPKLSVSLGSLVVDAAGELHLVP